MPGFVNLRVRSPYSLLDGMMSVKESVKMAVADGQPAMAIADDSLFASIAFSMEAMSAGLQPIAGQMLRVSGLGDNLGLVTLAVYAKDAVGLRNLSVLSSKSFVQRQHGIAPHVTFEELGACSDGLICLSGAHGGPLDNRIAGGREQAAAEIAASLKGMFGDRFYIELSRQERVPGNAIETGLLRIAADQDIPIVATSDASFADAEDVDIHDAVLTLKAGKTLLDPDRPRSSKDRRFMLTSDMEDLFADLPEAIENTSVIARRCHAFFRPGKPILPNPPGVSEEQLAVTLRERAEAGLRDRLAARAADPDNDRFSKAPDQEYFDRLNYEIDVIVKMGFPGYFLIVADFIQWAKNRGIPVGPGRGSGAGSLAAYALTITNLDPLRYGLLFERFLNPDRVSMPDFDIDFCRDRRQEVIEYVRQAYGADRVAQIATLGTLQTKLALREAGRVLAIPLREVNEVASLVPGGANPDMTLISAMEGNPDLAVMLSGKDRPHLAEMRKLAAGIENMAKSIGTHAAGIVIGNAPLAERFPLYRDPDSRMPATQYEMSYAEKSGLVKYDFLGLKTLSAIQLAVDMVNRHGGDLTPDAIPLDDRQSLKLLADGRTLGVFQVESEGMRKSLAQIEPDTIDDIIAVVALFRPGPLPYIETYANRKKGIESVDILHERMRPILQETYGIIVYQEQVMEIARVMAGYSLGQADLLRRAMGKKDREEMARQKKIFAEKALETGIIDEKTAKELFDLIERFADYGFNKSHAAAYAVISMQTAWLKAHYPAEFIAASMTYDADRQDSAFRLQCFVDEARQASIRTLSPDINKSGSVFLVEDLRDDEAGSTTAIRYSLGAIVGIGELSKSILRVRGNRPFANAEDFVARMSDAMLYPMASQIENLAATGAFDAFDKVNATPNRAALALAISAAFKDRKEAKKNKTADLFGDQPSFRMPEVPDWDVNDRMAREKKAIGFYLGRHPVQNFEDVLDDLGVTPIADLQDAYLRMTPKVTLACLPGQKIEKIGQASGKRYAIVRFGDMSGELDIPLFSKTLEKYRAIVEAGEPVLLRVSVSYKAGKKDTLFVDEVSSLQLEAVRAARSKSIASRP